MDFMLEVSIPSQSDELRYFPSSLQRNAVAQEYIYREAVTVCYIT